MSTVTFSHAKRIAAWALGGALILTVVVGVTIDVFDSEAPVSTVDAAAIAFECPGTSEPDPERAERTEALLRITESGSSLLEQAPGSSRMCFGDTVNQGVTSEGVALLDSNVSDRENAARLGHLLLHASEGSPFPEDSDPSRPCSVLVDQAIEAEARAHALELVLRRELGVVHPATTYPFERDFWAASPDERVDLLRAYFQEHREGGEGVRGFVAEYTRRCESSRDTKTH